jgi:hypothetical protein
LALGGCGPGRKSPPGHPASGQMGSRRDASRPR